MIAVADLIRLEIKAGNEAIVEDRGCAKEHRAGSLPFLSLLSPLMLTYERAECVIQASQCKILRAIQVAMCWVK